MNMQVGAFIQNLVSSIRGLKNFHFAFLPVVPSSISGRTMKFMSQKIGFVGVGRMGANMARRLQETGFAIAAVFDVNTHRRAIARPGTQLPPPPRI